MARKILNKGETYLSKSFEYMANDFLELKRYAMNFHTNAINLLFGCQT